MNHLRATAQRLDADCSRSGVKIDPDRSLQCARISRGQNVKQGLAQAIGRGTEIESWERLQPSTAICASDNSHLRKFTTALPGRALAPSIRAAATPKPRLSSKI